MPVERHQKDWIGRVDPSLDDFIELASKGSIVAQALEARAPSPTPRRLASTTGPTAKLARADKAVTAATKKFAPKIVKSLPYVEAGIMVKDVADLALSSKARSQARENYSQISRDINPITRTLSGVLEPIDTIYGAGEGISELVRSLMGAAKSKRDLEKRMREFQNKRT